MTASALFWIVFSWAFAPQGLAPNPGGMKGYSGGGGITFFNQAVGATAQGGGTSLAAAALNATAGNLLAVWVRAGDSASTITASDTAGNTFTPIAQCTGGPGGGQWLYAKNITGNASNVVTANYSVTEAFRAVMVLQFSGLSTTAPLDVSATPCASGTSTTPTSASFTTTTANEVILSGVTAGALSMTFTQGTGYTLGSTLTDGDAIVQFKIVSATQTGVTAAFTMNSSQSWLTDVITLK